jgi:hypothetical protein
MTDQITERRKHSRKIVNLDAEVTSGDFTCHAVIDNVSERGMSLTTDSEDLFGHRSRFTPGLKLIVKFTTSAGESISLNCRVRWSFKTGPDGIKRKVGLEVVFPPPSYIEFCKSI